MQLRTDWTKWEKTRKRGAIWFVLVWGVLCWGLTTGILFALVFSVISPTKMQASVWELSIPAFTFGGLFFGSLFWLTMESLYRCRADQPDR